MDNNRLNELRAAWLERADESAITELLTTVIDVATSEAMRYVGSWDAQEIGCSIGHWAFSRLTKFRAWDNQISAAATKLAKKRVRELSKYEKKKEQYKEYVMQTRKVATEERRGQVRDIACDALTSREWRVIHGLYWRGERTQQIARRLKRERKRGGERVSVTDRHVLRIRDSALEQLRLVLRKMGVTKNNWSEWYYEQ